MDLILYHTKDNMLRIINQNLKQVHFSDEMYGYELDFTTLEDLHTDWGSSFYYTGNLSAVSEKQMCSHHCQFYAGPHGSVNIDPRMTNLEFSRLLRAIPFPKLTEFEILFIWDNLQELAKNWLPDVGNIIVRLKWHYLRPNRFKLSVLRMIFGIQEPEDLALTYEKLNETKEKNEIHDDTDTTVRTGDGEKPTDDKACCLPEECVCGRNQ